MQCKKSFLGALCVVLLLTACNPQQPSELQRQSEQVTETYKDMLETQAKAVQALEIKSAYKLPIRPDDAEPILTINDVQAMTTPEQLAKALVAPDAAVRLAAVQGLNAFMGQLPDVALQRLINRLDAEEDAVIVTEVANLLGGSCHSAVMVYFLNNLKRDLPTINIAALKVLGNVAGYRAIEGIELLLTRLNNEQTTPKAAEVRIEAEVAKVKILARNGRPLLCTW